MRHQKQFLSIVIILSLFTGINCGKETGRGILGIQVPVGTGKVSKKEPYTISGVYENTPAHKAGVRPDDIIVQINDTPISNGMEYDYIYKNLLLGRPGEKVILMVSRGDKKIIFEIIRARRE